MSLDRRAGVPARAPRRLEPRRARRRAADGRRARRRSTPGTMMTENAFYPIFLLARAGARRRARAAPARCRCCVFLGALARRLRDARPGGRGAARRADRAARRRRARAPAARGARSSACSTGSSSAASASLVVARRGRRAAGASASLLGAYAAATNSSYDVGTVAALVPLASRRARSLRRLRARARGRAALRARARRSRAAERAVVAATVSLVAWLGVEVAAFASQPSVAAHRGAQPLLRRAAPLHLPRALDRARRCRGRASRSRSRVGRRRRARRGACRTSGSSTPRRRPTRSACSRSGRSRCGSRSTPRTSAGSSPACAAALLPRRRASCRGGSGSSLPALVLALYVARGAADRHAGRSARRSAPSSRGSRAPTATGSRRSSARSDPTQGVGRLDGRRTDRPDELVVIENEFFNRDVGAGLHDERPRARSGSRRRRSRSTAPTGALPRRGRSRSTSTTCSPTRACSVGRTHDRRRSEEGARAAARRRAAARATTSTAGIYCRLLVRRAARSTARFRCAGGTLLVAARQRSAAVLRRPARRARSCAAALVARVAVPPTRTVTMRVPLRGPHGACTSASRRRARRCPRGSSRATGHAPARHPLPRRSTAS